MPGRYIGDVLRGDVAFDRRACGKDDFIDAALGQLLFELFQSQLIRPVTIQR